MPKKKVQTPEKADSQVKKEHPKKRTNWILCIGAIAFVIAIAVMIVDQNVKIYESQKQLEKLREQITLQEIKNEELKDVAEAVEEVAAEEAEPVAEEAAEEAVEEAAEEEAPAEDAE